jgi:thiamine-monophosphate kinase
MNELQILSRIAARARGKDRGLVLGIGDDCAIYRPRGSAQDLLVTTDMMIEDIHFRRRTHPADAVGWKTLARGLSDIAAMGGEPRLCFVSLAVAPWADARWIDAFYGGLLRLARKTGTALAGGDLAHADRVMCDIVVCGEVARGKALRRDGARAGDGIYVSGRLGGSALGLETARGAAWKKHLRPEPRLELGRRLRGLRATACIDLSDGLSLDLYRLCLASGVTAELDGPLPVFRGASIEQALDGGEDYELLFTLRPGTAPPPSTMRIGTIRKGKPVLVQLGGCPLPPRGYDHFAGTGGAAV